MSFLDKLKRKTDVLEHDRMKEKEKQEKTAVQNISSYCQLDVDIYETPREFVIHAAIPGVDADKVDISVNEDNDTVIIKGEKISPIGAVREKEKAVVHHHQECQWGEFYRQIVLPQEVNTENIDAYEERGVLVIVLPILRLHKGQKNIKIKEKN